MPREQRLVFGEVAELYDRARPSYPPALIDRLVELAHRATAAAEGRRPGRVLDVGCGTGKAAVLLAARGLTGVGLEPDPDMAAVAGRNLVPYPGWSVVTGEFETFQSPTPFDLLTCAQAWHWLDPDRRFAQAARLLRPGGWLAVFWNRTGDDTSPVRRAIDAVYEDTFPAASPHGQLTRGQPPVGDPPPECGFGEARWQVFPWVQRYTAAEWTDMVQTHSDHRMLAPGVRQVLIDRLTAAIDANGGVFDCHYDCWLWTARR
jgi:SAM-dependent methyltransferase